MRAPFFSPPPPLPSPPAPPCWFSLDRSIEALSPDTHPHPHPHSLPALPQGPAPAALGQRRNKMEDAAPAMHAYPSSSAVAHALAAHHRPAAAVHDHAPAHGAGAMAWDVHTMDKMRCQALAAARTLHTQASREGEREPFAGV